MMSAERRVVDVGDDSYASRSSQALPPPTAKRKVHSEDEPLPTPTNPPKRAKKTTTGRSLSRKLTIVPVAVTDDEPGPSTRPLGSRDIQPAPTRGRSKQPADVTLPLPLRETPLIEKNREMRSKASERRRNSLEHRRRASESLGKNGGINESEPSISVVPHPDVKPDQYHRHISADVPPAQRTRQLLVWSSSHASGHASGSTAKGKNAASSSPNLPVLTPDSIEQLRTTQDAIIRMLADGTVDTMSFSEKGKDKARDGAKKLRPNPMNEKNRKRIDEWRSYIARADAEEKIWLHIKTSANGQLARLTNAHEAQSTSRRTKKPPEEWFPDLLDAVDERWRESARLAQSASSLDTSEIIDGAIQDLLRGVELHVDELEDMVNTTYEMAHRAESLLHKFFTTVSTQLSSRAAYGTSNDSGIASKHPSGMSLIELLSVPRDAAAMMDIRIDNVMAALRALSRIKPVVSSNATALATASKEAHVERRMTAVPPPTPGKDRAKTPRRGSTPGRNVKR